MMVIALFLKILLIIWYAGILALIRCLNFTIASFNSLVRFPLSFSRYVIESILWPVVVLAVIGGSIGLATGGLLGVAAVWLDILPRRQRSIRRVHSRNSVDMHQYSAATLPSGLISSSGDSRNERLFLPQKYGNYNNPKLGSSRS